MPSDYERYRHLLEHDWAQAARLLARYMGCKSSCAFSIIEQIANGGPPKRGNGRYSYRNAMKRMRGHRSYRI